MSTLPARHAATLARFNLDGDLYAAELSMRRVSREAEDLASATIDAREQATLPLRRWISKYANKHMGGGYTMSSDVTVKAWSNYQPTDPRHVAYPCVTVRFGQSPRIEARWTPTDGDLGRWIERIVAGWKVARGER